MSQPWKSEAKVIEYLYFWMLKSYSINVQRSLVDITSTLPKAKKKIQKSIKSTSVSLSRQSYFQLKILCDFHFSISLEIR